MHGFYVLMVDDLSPCLCHKNINLFIGVETVEALEALKDSPRKGFFFSYCCVVLCSIGLFHMMKMGQYVKFSNLKN